MSWEDAQVSSADAGPRAPVAWPGTPSPVLVSLLLPLQGELPKALLALLPLYHSNIYCRGMFNSKLHGQKEPLAPCSAHFHYGAFQTQGP